MNDGEERVVRQIADDHTIDLAFKVRNDVAEQVVRHRPRRCYVLDLQRDGVRFEDADPDWQHTIAVLVLQDDDRHVRDGVHHQPLDGHLNQHGAGAIPRTFDTTASPRKLCGPARRMRTGTIFPIHSAAALSPGATQLTTVLPLVRPEISESRRRLAESMRTSTIVPTACSWRRV